MLRRERGAKKFELTACHLYLLMIKPEFVACEAKGAIAK